MRARAGVDAAAFCLRLFDARLRFASDVCARCLSVTAAAVDDARTRFAAGTFIQAAAARCAMLRALLRYYARAHTRCRDAD